MNKETNKEMKIPRAINLYQIEFSHEIHSFLKTAWRLKITYTVLLITIMLWTCMKLLSVLQRDSIAGLILGLRLASERRRYTITPFLIGWAQTYLESDLNSTNHW